MRPASTFRSALLLAFAPAACASGSTNAEKTCSQASSPLQACPGAVVVRGIDVSVYQGTVAWPQVKAAGNAFAFARISDGIGFLDSEFARNWHEMKVAGLVRGSYQYFRASEDPVAQAALVASSLRDAGGLSPADLPVVMDIETADGQPASMVRAQMATWLAAVANATGKSPIIYTNFDTSVILGAGFAPYSLWVANWGARCPLMPAGWPAWAFWQYSDRGSVAGVAGAVDLDEFDGTLARLAVFGGAASEEAGAGDGGPEEGPVVDGASESEGSAASAPHAAPQAGAAVSAGSAMGGGGNGVPPTPAPVSCSP